MGVKIGVFFLLAIAACVSSLPARPSDTELIDPKYGNQPIVDTGVISAGGGGFFDNSFDIFRSMESAMRRMREQMGALLNRFGTSNGTIADVDDFSGFGLPAIPDLDLGKGNTTSVTKVIDGHKVVINETKYSNENANGGAFFKVRVIEVKPENPGQEPGVATNTTPRDVEPLENSKENEISKQAGNEVGSQSNAPEKLQQA